MLEFVIVFPVMLVLIFSCVQFALLLIAKQVVHYAAFCGARAAMVSVCETGGPTVNNDSWPQPDPQLAYAGLDAANCLGTSIGAGLNGLARSEAEWVACKVAANVCQSMVVASELNPAEIAEAKALIEQKTRAVVSHVVPLTVSATVEHDFALVVPIIGPILAWGMNPWDSKSPWRVTTADATGNRWPPFPHIRLTETVVLPKPYQTYIAAGNWQNPGGPAW